VIGSAPARSTFALPAVAASRSAERGEPSAVELEVLEFFDRFRDPLLRYICAFGIAVDEGEDLVQDVFFLLFRHLQRGGPRSNLQGWLFRVAHNLALKRRARRRRESTLVQHGLEPALDVTDPAPGPELRLVDSERRHRLLSVLSALSEKERRCLHLRHEGLRYREIAGVLGISLGGVAKLLARAIGRLERADQR
jgi:RNA polymerase sigma-70 factor (ECF subfamily)